MKALPDWKTMDTAKRLSMVKIMASDRLSASEIACRFTNATRMSVVGLCHRNKIALHSLPQSIPTLRPYDFEDNVDTLDVTHLVGLLSLERGMCKWPVTGDGAGTLFCGDATTHGPYCPTHSERAGAGYGRGARS